MYEKSLHWFRRDLRLEDNKALYEACLQSKQVIPVFVFDTNILNKLKNKKDRRVSFIFETLFQLKNELNNLGSNLIILYGDPVIEIIKISLELNIKCLFTNNDYENYAKKRDSAISQILNSKNIDFKKYKDQVIFEENEILNNSGFPYSKFTPYKNAWLKKFELINLDNYKPNFKKLIPKNKLKIQNNIDSIEKIFFEKTELFIQPGRTSAINTLNLFSNKILSYDKNRDKIDFEGTSHISTYLRFGVISIRELFNFANKYNSKGSDSWKNELIWREFYQMILSQFPYIENNSFKKKYESITWKENEYNFRKWCEGNTGFPIIDAAMRYFNLTGWMHNRLRMIVASFLTKDLLINYKLGEEYFAQNLIDFDLASNNGGWQWCASTGCDSQPFFRVFNPELQSKKFDPNGFFIKKYCPELALFSEKEIHAPYKTKLNSQKKAKCIIGINYPSPIVNHEENRIKAINMFKNLD